MAPGESPSAGAPPAFLQSMLKISLTLRNAGEDVSLSTARRFATETLKESIEVSYILRPNKKMPAFRVTRPNPNLPAKPKKKSGFLEKI